MKIFLNDKFIAPLIAINALLTVYLCYDNPPFGNVVLCFDYVITTLFAIEITYKINIYKKAFFEKKWNWFDFLVVAISFIALILQIFWIKVGILENLVILRVLRLFKFFRIIRIIPDIDKIYGNLIKALRVTSGIILGGFIILIIIGVVLCSMYKTYDPEHFRDPLISIYSVFRIFSVEGWYEIPDSMTESASYLNATFIRFLFSILVLFGTFILGFIISSISDELAADNNDELMAKTKDLELKIDLLNEKMDRINSEYKRSSR